MKEISSLDYWCERLKLWQQSRAELRISQQTNDVFFEKLKHELNELPEFGNKDAMEEMILKKIGMCAMEQKYHGPCDANQD